MPECRRDCFGVLKDDRNCLGTLDKHINHCTKVSHFTVLPGNTLHIGQVGLPLSIDPSHIGMVFAEPTARWLVQRIGLLAPKIFLDRLSRDTWDIELPNASQALLNPILGIKIFGVVINITLSLGGHWQIDIRVGNK